MFICRCRCAASHLLANAAGSVARSFFKTAVFFLVAVRAFPFLRVLIRCDSWVIKYFVFLNVWIRVGCQMLFPFYLCLFGDGPFGRFLFPFRMELGNEGRRTFAGTTKTTRGVKFSYVHCSPRGDDLVCVWMVVSAGVFGDLCPSKRFARCAIRNCFFVC